MNKPITSRERQDLDKILGQFDAKSSWWRSPRAKWAGVLAAVLTIVLIWSSLRDGTQNVRYATQPVTRGGLVVLVTATGSVQPRNKVDVSSELSGTVRKVFVDFNSPVKTGQPLATLDTDKLVATLDSSRARVVAAKAKVADADAAVVQTEKDLARKKALVGKQISSVHDFDVAQAAYDRAVASAASARADVGAAEADLRLNETNLVKASIVSPINGVVLKRNVDPGQTVASSFQAPVLFYIAEDLTQMELQVDVDEADVGKVADGQTAIFSVDAFPDRKFPAKIRYVRYASETLQGVVTYKAVLDIDNADLSLRPGMTATAEIRVTEVADALLIPNQALRYSPPAAAPKQSFLRRIMPGMPQFRPASPREQSGANRTIWVLRNAKPEQVSVTVGPTDGKLTVVTGGDIKLGEQVITDQVTPRG